MVQVIDPAQPTQDAGSQVPCGEAVVQNVGISAARSTYVAAYMWNSSQMFQHLTTGKSHGSAFSPQEFSELSYRENVLPVEMGNIPEHI